MSLYANVSARVFAGMARPRETSTPCKYDTPISISVYDIGRSRCPGVSVPLYAAIILYGYTVCTYRVSFSMYRVCLSRTEALGFVFFMENNPHSGSFQSSLGISATEFHHRLPRLRLYRSSAALGICFHSYAPISSRLFRALDATTIEVILFHRGRSMDRFVQWILIPRSSNEFSYVAAVWRRLFLIRIFLWWNISERN